MDDLKLIISRMLLRPVKLSLRWSWGLFLLILEIKQSGSRCLNLSSNWCLLLEREWPDTLMPNADWWRECYSSGRTRQSTNLCLSCPAQCYCSGVIWILGWGLRNATSLRSCIPKPPWYASKLVTVPTMKLLNKWTKLCSILQTLFKWVIGSFTQKTLTL